ncbi:MAG: hypothetical protein HFJ50_03870 [Clostridia bacterium]|jgi:hypothetical protein|nr:hypothetical protein [Clostridia bacterium]
MEFMPFFRRPYYYQNYTRNRYGQVSQNEVSYSQKTNQNLKSNQNLNSRGGQNKNNFYQEEMKETKTQNSRITKNQIEEQSDPIFEIFGIKLYFDDILIVSLLFFLYSEGVEDNLLFIALILLLLS